MTVRDLILAAMRKVADENAITLVPDVNDFTVLLESGLDSLGFAILVARLEEDLGYDPFTLMEEPVYPRTFGEFVMMYQKFAP